MAAEARSDNTQMPKIEVPQEKKSSNEKSKETRVPEITELKQENKKSEDTQMPKIKVPQEQKSSNEKSKETRVPEITELQQENKKSEDTQMPKIKVPQEQKSSNEKSKETRVPEITEVEQENKKSEEVKGELKKEDEIRTKEVVEKEKVKDEGSESFSPVAEKSASFKEESNLLSDLKEHEKKALFELRSKIEEAMVGNKLFKEKEEVVKELEKVKKTLEDEVEKTAKSTQEGNDKENSIEKKEEYPIKENEKGVAEKGEEKSTKKEENAEGKKIEKGVAEKGDSKEKSTENEEKKEGKPEKENAEGKKNEKGGAEKGNFKEKSTKNEEKKEENQSKENAEEKKFGKGGAGKGDFEEISMINDKEIAEENDDAKEGEKEGVFDKDCTIWGVSLLPSKGDKGTDKILLKFLRAREFKVNEAFEMLRNTLQWRKEHNIDSVLNEEYASDLASVGYMKGVDREGHPICYNVYGVFGNDEIYKKIFGTEENRDKFLKWRFQLMEKGIQKLDFNNDKGVSSLLQINDLKNLPALSRKELRLATKRVVGLLQDNYPEFVARNIFINVPFWYYAFNALFSPFLSQRTKSKFVFARPSRVTDTLLKYMPAEQIPVYYGGLMRENDSDFSVEDGVWEVFVKGGSVETIEIPAPEIGTTIIWDLTVLGWEVNYKEEFVPADEGSYTIIVSKERKMGWQEGSSSVRNSFRSNEPGKVMITINNGSFKRKHVLYRYKTKDYLIDTSPLSSS